MDNQRRKSMTYQYARLAVGRLKRYRDAWDIVPLTESGEELPTMSEQDLENLTWTKKVIDYEIKDGVMYCRLEGVK
jgi:hypothetical protein